MAEIIQLDGRVRRPRHQRSVDLAIASEKEVFSGSNLRNLIDSWIVPKLVDDWMNEPTDPVSRPNEDNGEQS